MARKKTLSAVSNATYSTVLGDLVRMVEEARRASARSVNMVMTATYWAIGRRLVEQEQHGAARAGYGEELVERLSVDLSARFGRGFGRRNLFQMRAFYLAYREIVQTVPAQSRSLGDAQKVRTSPALSTVTVAGVMLPAFPLPWSHHVRLLTVRNLEARGFYESEGLRGGWTLRQLERQIGSQFYERTLLSRNRAAMLHRGQVRRPDDTLTPEEEIKDPYVLEVPRVEGRILRDGARSGAHCEA